MNFDCISSVAGDVSAPASNTAAVVTYAAAAGLKHCISGLVWSYDGTPTGGSIKIEDGAGNIVFGPHAITVGGVGILVFPNPKKSSAANVALITTLAAGGAGVSGVVSIVNHWTEN
jgi:hypothetical protein